MISYHGGTAFIRSVARSWVAAWWTRKGLRSYRPMVEVEKRLPKLHSAHWNLQGCL